MLHAIAAIKQIGQKGDRLGHDRTPHVAGGQLRKTLACE